jgi:hypothetical protein
MHGQQNRKLTIKFHLSHRKCLYAVRFGFVSALQAGELHSAHVKMVTICGFTLSILCKGYVTERQRYLPKEMLKPITGTV